MGHRFHLWIVGVVAAGLLCCAPRLLCQVQVGDNTLFNLDGSIASSYAGGYGNQNSSDHGIGVGGNANLAGSYYSPQFLQFTVSPFYNQSRDSSSYSAIMDSSGVTAAANIFGGSHFPGYVSYSDLHNGQSNYALPGIGNFKTDGNTQSFGAGWAVNLPNLPNVSLGYQQSSSDSSLYGLPGNTTNDFHSLFADASYMLEGFHLSGGIHHTSGSAEIPQIEPGQPSESDSSDTTSYNFGMSRNIILQGSTWANFTRDSTNYDSYGVGTSETADILSGGVNLKPTDKLSAQFNGNYNSNLAGSLFQAVNTSGVLAPVSIPAGASHSWLLAGSAQYALFSGMYVGGGVTHEDQLFLGTSYTSTAYSGFAGYGHDLLGGRFNGNVVVTRSELSDTGESLLGFTSLASYVRRFGNWQVSGSFGYSENVQTILLAYTSSGYNYSVSASRRIGKLFWNGSAGGSSTLITQLNSPSNFTQSYSMGLAARWLGVSGGYSKSGGSGVLTNTGIAVVPTGVPTELLPSAVTFGGTSYSAGLGATPVRGFQLNGSFVKSEYNTANGTAGALSSNNKTEQINAYLLYRFRRVNFVSGYSRLLQGFSASGLPATALTSYYVGITRSFKFF